MTTLMRTLTDQMSQAVIFGYVHRRQLHLHNASRNKPDYSHLSKDDLLDLTFIDGFFEQVAQTYLMQSDDQFVATCAAKVSRAKARKLLAIDDETDYLHGRAGMQKARKAMFGLGANYLANSDRYSAIVDTPLETVAEAA